MRGPRFSEMVISAALDAAEITIGPTIDGLVRVEAVTFQLTLAIDQPATVEFSTTDGLASLLVSSNTMSVASTPQTLAGFIGAQQTGGDADLLAGAGSPGVILVNTVVTIPLPNIWWDADMLITVSTPGGGATIAKPGIWLSYSGELER